MRRGIQSLFRSIPGTYERANRLLTLGMDGFWRRAAARIAAAGSGAVWLDACCGTGDMTGELRHLNAHATIVGVDFSLPMLAEARARRAGVANGFVLGDVTALPLADNTFDLVTVSFAMRNISPTRDDLLCALQEFHRVLTPGGRFVCIESSRPTCRPVRWGFDLYTRLVVARLGAAVSGEREPYRYLAASMRSFYSASELCEVIRDAGFSQVTARPMMLGAVAIHSAIKS